MLFVTIFAVPEPKATGRALSGSGPRCGSAGQGCSLVPDTGFSGINDVGSQGPFCRLQGPCLEMPPSEQP